MIKITRKNIGYFAGDLLEVLERERIDSGTKLTEIARRGQRFTAENQVVVVIESRLSNAGTSADTISYVIRGLGIPLEMRINHCLNYGLFIVKSAEILPGYSPFAQDPLGNVAQENRQAGLSFPGALEHLRELKKYSDS